MSRSDFYHYQWGLNNYSGIAGAMLARSGISPMPGYLDGDTGYWVTMTDECKWDWLDRDLGGRYLIMETLFKHWPTNMWIQQALDGTAELVRKYRVLPGDVAEVVVNPVVENRMIDGRPCLVIAINEHVEINGISVLPVPLKDRKGAVKNNGDVQEEGTPWGEEEKPVKKPADDTDEIRPVATGICSVKDM